MHDIISSYFHRTIFMFFGVVMLLFFIVLLFYFIVIVYRYFSIFVLDSEFLAQFIKHMD